MGECNIIKPNFDVVSSNYYQAEAYNFFAYEKYLFWMVKLATNRFRWEGLPDTCDPVFLERQLLTHGVCAICKPYDSENWYTLPVAYDQNDREGLNIYGRPSKWRCIGKNGDKFESDWTRGTLVYNSAALLPVMDSLNMIARKLAHYDRTEDVNLAVQKRPWIITCADKSQKTAIINAFNNVAIGNPLVIGGTSLMEGVQVHTESLDVPFKGMELHSAKRNIFLEAYQLLGIEALAYEKGERMIEAEAEGNATPTNVMLLDGLQGRRGNGTFGIDYLNKEFGLNVSCVFNRDYESYNYNYERDMERQAQLGDVSEDVTINEQIAD